MHSKHTTRQIKSRIEGRLKKQIAEGFLKL